MKKLLSPSWWATHWPNALLYVAVCAVFVFTVGTNSARRELDVQNARQQAEQLRQANIRFCESSNGRTVVLRDFVLGVTQDPDPRQFEFITDPQTRQGAFDQAKRSRAEMRSRVATTFTLRDCASDFPPAS